MSYVQLSKINIINKLLISLTWHSFFAQKVSLKLQPLIMPPPPIGGALSDAFVWHLTSVTYIGHNSRTERHRNNKIGTEVAHVTRDSDTTFKVKITRPLWLVVLAGQHGRTVMVTYPDAYMTVMYQCELNPCRPVWGNITLWLQLYAADISLSCCCCRSVKRFW